MILELDREKLLKVMVAVDSIAALKGGLSLAATITEEDNITDEDGGTGDFTSPVYDGWRAAIELLFSTPKMLEALDEGIEDQRLYNKVITDLMTRLGISKREAEKIVEESEKKA